MDWIKFIIGILLVFGSFSVGRWTAQVDDAKYLNECQEAVQDQQDLLDLYHTNINEICAIEFEKMGC